jgi:dihydroxyacetone kinase phosphotransfer subunit
MIGIVLVSHTHLLATGLAQLVAQVSQDKVKIATAGGVDDETIGTNAERIQQAINQVYSQDGILILFDLGSALISAQLAIEGLPPEQQANIKLSGAPFVEGAYVAVVEASLGRSLHEVNQAAEAAKDMPKIL